MPIKAKRIIDKLRQDLYDPIYKAKSAAARSTTQQVTQAAMGRGGTRTAKTLMRVVPAVAGASILGGYIGGRVHAGMKRRRELLAQSQQSYEGFSGGGETVATVGEGATKPRMIRRGPRSIKVGMTKGDMAENKALHSVYSVVKGFNPNARRSFDVKHKPSKDRLPASVRDKTLFPDDPADKHKQQTPPGNKGSGVSDLNAKLQGLIHTVDQLEKALNNAAKIFSNLQDMKRKSGQLGGGLKDQGTIAIIKDKKRQWDQWIARLEDFLPDDGETVSQKYDDLLSEGLNISRALEDAVDDINRVCKDLGATV